MMDFLTNIVFWDVLLLIIFTIGVTIFLYKRRKKIEREGPLFLYKTQIGVKILDRLGKKFKRLWGILSYFIVAIGYVLMISFTYLLIKSVIIYLVYPQITDLVKAPPLMLLFPYFNRFFGASELFPDLHFIYFIIAIGVIAIVHEGFHGIYARYHNVRIKSTGFGFLGPILAFFVEQDDKQMTKKKIFPQLSILAAGVFANVITALLFFFLFWLLFTGCYAPYGINAMSYASSIVPSAFLMNASITDEKIEVDGINVTKIIVDDKSYLVSEDFFDIDLEEVEGVYVYQDQPAIRAGLRGTIISINDNDIDSIDTLRNELDRYQVGEEVRIVTDYDDMLHVYDIELGESYEEEGRTVMGVGIGENLLWMFRIIEPFKDYGVEYRPKAAPEFTNFIYYLLAWIVLLNALVALFNMLPITIFDGGRFFYLTVLGLTKNKKMAGKSIEFMSWFLLLLALLIMASWVIRRFFIGI